MCIFSSFQLMVQRNSNKSEASGWKKNLQFEVQFRFSAQLEFVDVVELVPPADTKGGENLSPVRYRSPANASKVPQQCKRARLIHAIAKHSHYGHVAPGAAIKMRAILCRFSARHVHRMNLVFWPRRGVCSICSKQHYSRTRCSSRTM